MWVLLLTTNLLLKTAFAANKIEFFLQPHENAGTECQYKPSGQPHGYLVTCGQRQFRVHHFARPYLNQQQLSWEVLYWVTNMKSPKEHEQTGTSLWVKAEPKSQIQVLKLGQAIDADTATLDLTIHLPQIDHKTK